MKIGSLFAGYAGLDLAVEAVYGGQLGWVSEIDKGACKVLAHRYPDVPNLGDITTIDWTAVEPVDILTGGSPCQDLSHAGRRAGMTEGTRSNLWVAMREAIAQLKPQLVIWENVRGAASACAESEADSDLGSCPRCVDPDGGARHAPNLRALGRVVGDLASLGYVGRVHGLRAADVGAPHGRFRYFLVATDASHGADHGERSRSEPWPRSKAATDAGGEHGQQRRITAPRQAESGQALSEPTGRDRAPLTLLPTPKVTDEHHMSPADLQRNDPGLRAIAGLLPTPRATDGTKGGPGQRGSSGDLMLPSAVALLPTPRASDGPDASSHGRTWSKTDRSLHTVDYLGEVDNDRWGDYAAGIARWEQILGRQAPDPTQLSKKGNPQLSPRFVEWMMGLPDGWVTDVPGVTRNQALRMLGNGVVPQQAAHALRVMAGWQAVA